MDLNRITLIGHVVRDPEHRAVGKGGVSVFSIATNRVWSDPSTQQKKSAVDFHSVSAWGKIGEVAQRYLRKGAKVYVEGRLAQRTYTSKGVKKTAAEVIVENLILLSPKAPTPERSEDSM